MKKVLVAQSLYPESMDVLVATNGDDLLHAIRKCIDPEDFKEAMGYESDEHSDEDVVSAYFGEIYEEDGCTYIGEEWAISEVEVIGS